MLSTTHIHSIEERLDISQPTIVAFCKKWQIQELALFGSVLRADFRPDSDIDVLVTFDPVFRRGLSETIDIHAELAELLQRDVDLIVKKSLQRSENIPRRDRILNSSQVIYAA